MATSRNVGCFLRLSYYTKYFLRQRGFVRRVSFSTLFIGPCESISYFLPWKVTHFGHIISEFHEMKVGDRAKEPCDEGRESGKKRRGNMKNKVFIRWIDSSKRKQR